MTATPRQARKVLLSSLIGSTIEWYEFFIYGTAASLVFNDLFFPDFDPLVGTLLSLSTFGIAFVIRPLGGVVFGHFGDRIGRKSMLVLTLTLMGGATFAIGLLPTYEQIGVAAPLLLVLVRLIQGFSLGGEYGGAVLMSVEHAERRKRGLYGAIVNTGVGWGLLLANLIFLPVTQLPDDALRSWGWRVPFLLSAALVALGLFIRLKVDESPDFEKAKQSGEVRKTPVAEVLRHHWLLAALMCVSYLATGVVFYIGAVFSLSYGTGHTGLSENTMLGLVISGTVVTLVCIPLFGVWSDRIGRKKVFLAGIAGLVVAPFPWFALIDTENTALALLGFVLLFLPWSATYAAMPTFFAQVFPVGVRYTGMSVGYTLGTVLGGGFAPMIATYLLDKTGDWPAIALYMSLAGVISFIATALLREWPATGQPEAAAELADAKG